MNSEGKNSQNSVMPRYKYPEPLVFHDGRLAFLPTPSATFCMFVWIPIEITLAIYRTLLGIFLPYKLALIGTCIRSLKWYIDLTIKGCVSEKSEPNKEVIFEYAHIGHFLIQFS